MDRLADDEISALFRTVKSVGDLPNVIYVLLYDRHKVAAALARDQKDNGDKFLEKIIQVPIKVPEPSKFTIRAMVKNGLAKLKKCDNRSTPSGRRAHAILNNCITPLISSPREVHLLLNKTNFYYASIGDEVEFYDLAGITGIECFCPKLYS
ncbi:P-loop NTPase fold protein [Bifidobacterium pseudocatenulatum]|uniref:P-loop NTPase fold protein n=1 Tax=Bifidobacterium pseudocatenulatum TaxID=28026 RepID=UPI00299CDD9F|nr:P-loop NTPase fold protein [Bifidobacterium pseudocatenulatum]